MYVLALAALSLSIHLSGVDVDDLVPGDGVALDPVPPVVSAVDLPQRAGSPSDPGPTVPWGFGAMAAVGALGAGIRSSRRRRRSSEPLFVLVHGNGGSASDFDSLLEQLGVEPSDAVAFDWRTATPAPTSTEASETASTEVAARELDELIRELSLDNANIYTLHHSKGGAAGVAMIAALDDGTRPPIDGYRGAALLDPAIATGPVGVMQRFGEWTTSLPDNGNFDPIQCTDDGCRDRRENLGEASGVEVIVVRNPDAVVTNFTDRPEGLRVLDLVDDGKPSALWYWNNPWVFAGRVAEAHRSVLEHWTVADCISAEVADPGSCVWKGDGWRPRIAWGSANSRNKVR